MKKTNPLLLLLGSIGLILLAVAMTTLIDRTQNKDTSADVRARAANSGVEFVGTVLNTDPFTVENLQFAGATNTGKSLGTFEILLPAAVNGGAFQPGQKVLVIGNAQTFKVNTDGTPNTLTALDIKSQ